VTERILLKQTVGPKFSSYTGFVKAKYRSSDKTHHTAHIVH